LNSKCPKHGVNAKNGC